MCVALNDERLLHFFKLFFLNLCSDIKGHMNLRLLNKFCIVSLKKDYFCVSRSRQSTKRKAPDTVEESPSKRFSPPKKSQSVRCINLVKMENMGINV